LELDAQVEKCAHEGFQQGSMLDGSWVYPEFWNISAALCGANKNVIGTKEMGLCVFSHW
jgi:hypothetical protein